MCGLEPRTIAVRSPVNGHLTSLLRNRFGPEGRGSAEPRQLGNHRLKRALLHGCGV